ncbi:MAG: AAA family ATPase [Meiothermus sp.]|nr:AAA family ATPase [Meiothermus sp.]
MLIELHLQNFRCFENHTVPFKSRTIVIGRNNAGKTTLVEALRLVSIVTERFESLTYKHPPKWGQIPRRELGVQPSLKNIEFNFDNLFFRYGSPPAIIHAKFSNGSHIKIYLGEQGENHCVIYTPDDKIVKARGMARNVDLPSVQIMPQIGPLAKKETRLTDEYVKRAASSALSSQHFRNQLRVFTDSYLEFSRMTEVTWPGLQITELREPRAEDEIHQLFIRDDNFVAEVGNMGHGLQMWLQTIWFLSRSARASSVILDEPDVYMHPDLQRRLIRFVSKRFPQLIVTTHSVEIMSEVDPNDILVIEKERSESRFASSLPTVQKIIEDVGSVHNVQLSRLWNAKCCLLLEGDDLSLLSPVYDTIFSESNEGLQSIPNFSMGGWGGWAYALGTARFLKNSGGNTIKIFCIFDSDYHTQDQKNKRLQEAKSEGISIHIWQRKEIENYFIIPVVILRAIRQRSKIDKPAPTVGEIESKIEELAEGLKDEVLDSMSDAIRAQDKGLSGGAANKRAREQLKTVWRNLDDKIARVSGKELISQLSAWSQKEYGATLSASILSRFLTRDDIPSEMADLLERIHNTSRGAGQ